MPQFRRLVMIITIRDNVRKTHPSLVMRILKLHYRQGFESLPTFRGLSSNNIHKINRITYKITTYYWWLLIKNKPKCKPELIPPTCWSPHHVTHVIMCCCSPTQAMRDMSSVYPSKQSQVYPSCTRTHRPFSHPFSTPHSSARSPSNASYGSERQVQKMWMSK